MSAPRLNAPRLTAPRSNAQRAAALVAVLGLLASTEGCDRMRTMFASTNGSANGAENGSTSGGASSAETEATTDGSSGATSGAGQRVALADPAPPDASGPSPVPDQRPPSEDVTPERAARAVSFPVVPEAVTESMFPDDARTKFAGAQVPVLAPVGLSEEQAQRFVDTFRATPDGYFARMSMPEFDVVVNGTKIYAIPPESAGATERDTTELHVTESEDGMSATFNRFGADYSVEFACRGAGGEEGAKCLTEAQAREFVERLIAVGGGGR
jgi:hypothetical protein